MSVAQTFLPHVGVPAIDRDHEVLLGILQRLDRDLGRGRYSSVQPLLTSLRAYFDAHFENEEDLMREHDYPEIEDHVHQHQDMWKQIESVENSDDDAKNKIRRTVDVLRLWIHKHLDKCDRKLGDFLISKSVPLG